jgi:histone H3/H4|eukprot:COSAG01_NODE_6780_length_3502_cov_3.015281_1_plen_58_part_00
MKADDDVKNIKPEAVVTMTKATELFIEFFVEQAFRFTVKNKRKILGYKVSAGRGDAP